MLPKGKLLEDYLHSTLHQSRKVISTFAMNPVGIWQMMQSNTKLEQHCLAVLGVKKSEEKCYKRESCLKLTWTQPYCTSPEMCISTFAVEPVGIWQIRQGKVKEGLFEVLLAGEMMSEHQHLVSLINFDNVAAIVYWQLWPTGSSGAFSTFTLNTSYCIISKVYPK